MESWRLGQDGGQFSWNEGVGEQEDESVTAGFLSDDEEEERGSKGEQDESSATSSPGGSAFSHRSTTTDDSSRPSTGGSDLDGDLPSSLSTTSLREALTAIGSHSTVQEKSASLPLPRLQLNPSSPTSPHPPRGHLHHSFSEPARPSSRHIPSADQTPTAGSFTFPPKQHSAHDPEPSPRPSFPRFESDDNSSLPAAPALIPLAFASKGRHSLQHRKTHSGSFGPSGIHKRTTSASLRLNVRGSPSVGPGSAWGSEDLEELEEQGLRVHDFRETVLMRDLDALEDGAMTPTAGDPSSVRLSPVVVRRGSISHTLSRNNSASSSLSRSNSGTLGRSNSGNGGRSRHSRGMSRTSTSPLAMRQEALPPPAPVQAGKRTAMGIEPWELMRRLEDLERKGKGKELLVVDVRTLSAFLGETGRIKSSVNVNFPSLLIKRFRKGNTANFALNAFITTECGKSIFESVTKSATKPGTLDGIDVVVVDERAETRDPASTSPGSVLLSVLERRDEGGSIYFLTKPFSALLSEAWSREWIVEGEGSEEDVSFGAGGGSFVARKEVVGNGGGLLTLQPASNHSQLPRLAHNSSTSPARFDSSPPDTPLASPKTPGGTRTRPPKLRRIDTSDDLLGQRGSGAPPLPRIRMSSPPHDAPSSGGSSGSRSKPSSMSIQSLCHVQSKSPSALQTRFEETDIGPPPTARPSHFSPTTPKNNSDTPPFELSTIIPGFLYLGSEPTRKEDLDQLEQLGVKQVLNLALECEDRDGEIRRRFERYWKIPMRDFVEETGVQKSIEDACRILADAQLQSKPIYCHCRAGKSRSVTIVLAYLVHRNHWTLKRAYAHVSERRKGISPNIGFVAELMKWEERERGGKSHGVFGSSPSFTPSASVSQSAAATTSYFAVPTELQRSDSGGANAGRSRARIRDSLPPVGGTGYDGVKRQERGGEGEREMEVRGVDGAWVAARRDPRDVNSMAPRRASKAGLESASLTSWD